ncbi:hypothetical protein [uncultured Kordia sp.]|uniref:hypothetical protein n=1 Tax=uncultured Kordia sp. TaxID=507699 RepID=UPI002620E81C|nr:hypothetical protein [uncultured Kordia sp.]
MSKIELSEAEDALDEYALNLLEKNDVYEYIAIKEDQTSGYVFEIGMKRRGLRPMSRPIIPNNKYVRSLYKGVLLSDYIPVPKSYVPKRNICFFEERHFLDKKIRVHFEYNYLNEVKALKEVSVEKRVSYEDYDDFELKIQPGNTIADNLSLGGTLGLVFKLKKFENRYFGLSNSHVLNSTNKKKKLFKIKTHYPFFSREGRNKVGSLFWSEYSDYLDAAIVIFHNDAHERLELNNKCNFNIDIEIGEPVFGKQIGICGADTQISYDVTRNKKHIYSTNAYVKIHNSSGEKIYKNQIMIDHFTTNGDSGSVIIDNSGKIIGLLIGSSIGHKKFSIANNINKIFNHSFEKPQKVFLDNKESFFVESFELA